MKTTSQGIINQGATIRHLDQLLNLNQTQSYLREQLSLVLKEML